MNVIYCGCVWIKCNTSSVAWA